MPGDMLSPQTPCPQRMRVTCQRGKCCPSDPLPSKDTGHMSTGEMLRNAVPCAPSDPLPIIEGVKGGTYVPLGMYVPLVISGKTCPRCALTPLQNLT